MAAMPALHHVPFRGNFDGWMDGWMKDIWEPASYIALRLIVSLRILCNALYGHPFSEYCSYEKNIFLKIFFEVNFLNLVILC